MHKQPLDKHEIDGGVECVLGRVIGGRGSPEKSAILVNFNRSDAAAAEYGMSRVANEFSLRFATWHRIRKTLNIHSPAARGQQERRHCLWDLRQGI